ncbi:hypothetical protein TNCV_1462101 [Trichonephila clavipes]|nr:hypothetical protein TNCV_1462101 [Trichonephila clavipes]
MYPQSIIFDSSGPGKALPQVNYSPITHVSSMTKRTAIFPTRLGDIVVHLQQKLQYVATRWSRVDVTLKIIGGWSGDVLCSPMKAASVVVSMMAVYWLEEGLVSASTQPFCDLNALNQHLEL